MTPATRAAAALAGLCLLGGCASGLTTTKTTASAPATTKTTASAPASTKPAPAPTAPPTTAPPTTLSPLEVSRIAISAWYSSYGKDIDHLVDAMRETTDAANAGDIDGLHDGCVQVRAAVRSAQGHPAIPAANVNGEYQAALTSFSRAATYCISGTANTDADDISEATTYIRSGSEHLDRANVALRAYLP